MLPKYELMVADFYNIAIGNVKKMVTNVFDNEKHVLLYENLQLYLRLRLKLKSLCITIQNTKNDRSRKNGNDEKPLNKLMNNDK